jgi:hypothetical protein
VHWKKIAGEGGVLETLQSVMWASSALLGLVAGLSARRSRDRLNLLWLGVVASGILLRESDGHEWFNPEVIGPWGLHYRLDWWTDGSVPVVIKLLWLGLIAFAGITLVAPLLLARPDGLAQLRRRDVGAVMFILAIACIAFGWVADDLLGRGLLVPPAVSKVFEETGELIGAAAYLVSVLASALEPLDLREGRFVTTPAA